jgi:HSP20 family protein
MATTTVTKPEPKEAKASRQEMASVDDRPFFMSRVRDEFDRLFQRFTRNWPTLWEMGGSTWDWDVDLQEKDDALIVTAEAPGFEANDFDIQVEDHRLVMRASRKTETKEKDNQKFEERESYQSITLPCDVSKDKVEATYRNGVLKVTLPKSPEAQARKIAVKPN